MNARRRLLAERWYEKDFEVDCFESIGLEKRERLERCTWRRCRDVWVLAWVRECACTARNAITRAGARVICIVLTVPFRSPWLLFIGHFLRLRVTGIIDKLDLDVYGNGHILAARLVFSLGSHVFNVISAQNFREIQASSTLPLLHTRGICICIDIIWSSLRNTGNKNFLRFVFLVFPFLFSLSSEKIEFEINWKL